LDDVIYTGNGGGEVKYLQHTYTAVTFESFKTLTQNMLHLMCEHIFYTFILPEISCDLNGIYDVTGNAKISAKTNTT